MASKSKFNVIAGEKYGNMLAEEYVQITTKGGNTE